MEKTSAPVDWDVVRLEYVNSDISQRDLADKLGVSISTLTKRSANEKWEKARKAARKAQADLAQEAINRKAADELVTFNQQDLKLAKALRAMIVRRMNNAVNKDTVLTAMEIRTLSGAAESVQKIGRLALGVTTNNQGISNPDGTPLTPPSFNVVWDDVADDDENDQTT